MIIPQTPLWNPTLILGIINTDPGYNTQTCIGYAPSQRRRCRNPIRADNRAFIADILDEISYLQPSHPSVVKKLRSIAAPCLCVRFHQGQADEVLMGWRRKISQLDVGHEKKERRSAKPVKQERVTSREKSLEQQLRQMEELLARMQERLDSQDQPRSQTFEDKEAEERKRKKKQEKERLAKEKEKAEQDAKQQRERERREQTERLRQQAQRRKEEAERLAREKARKERLEWDLLWQKYQDRWTAFKASPSKNASDIPWPVKTCGQEVHFLDVKEFYEKAARKEKGKEFVKAMKKESLRWHPNCPSSVRRLEGLVIGKTEGDWIETVVRVLTGLIDEGAGKEAEWI